MYVVLEPEHHALVSFGSGSQFSFGALPILGDLMPAAFCPFAVGLRQEVGPPGEPSLTRGIAQFG
jgi:hypothetical protein